LGDAWLSFFPADHDRFAFRVKWPHDGRVDPSPVLNENAAPLEQRMAALGIRESDLEETFVRSGGAGGQKVNKSSSCVMLLHRPTGLRVKCQTSRYQAMNRSLARRLLSDKIEQMKKRRAEGERANIEKARRQKRKRSRSAKERMLADKSRHGEKKRLRGAIRLD
jgi:peptide chain release factor